MKPVIQNALFGSPSQYFAKVKNLFGASLIGYWPLGESSGSSAQDLSGSGFTGTYSNCSLANATPPIFLRSLAPSFNGTTSKVDIYSAGFNTAFKGQEGAIGLWFKVSAAADWNVANYSPFGFQVNSANRVFIRTMTPYGLAMYYNAGGDSDYLLQGKLNNFTDWIEMWVSWSYSAGELYVYSNGLLHEWMKWNNDNFPKTLTGEWVGSLDPNYALIGNYSAPWKGWVSHVRLLDRPVTPAEVRALNPYPVILFDGDSRTGSKTYPFEAFGLSAKTWYGFKHLGTSGAGLETLISNAPTDVDPVRNGSSSIVVIWAGVNNSGATAQDIHDLIRSYSLARKAAGWKVLVCTEIDAQDAARLANNWPTKYLEVNSLLRADYTTFADGLADLGDNEFLQDATNTTYFNADKVHLVNAGYTVVAGIVGPALAAL